MTAPDLQFLLRTGTYGSIGNNERIPYMQWLSTLFVALSLSPPSPLPPSLTPPPCCLLSPPHRKETERGAFSTNVCEDNTRIQQEQTFLGWQEVEDNQIIMRSTYEIPGYTAPHLRSPAAVGANLPAEVTPASQISLAAGCAPFSAVCLGVCERHKKKKKKSWVCILWKRFFTGFGVHGATDAREIARTP